MIADRVWSDLRQPIRPVALEPLTSSDHRRTTETSLADKPSAASKIIHARRATP